MKIEEYMKTLPTDMISGESARLTERSLRDIFKLVELNNDDVFYHLGCNDEKGVTIAIREFGVKKAIGIDNNSVKIKDAKKAASKSDLPGSFICQDIKESSLTDATVILFWFTDDSIIDTMMKKFARLNPDTRIVTLWGPLPGCLPHSVEFPYIINKIPLKRADSLQDQILAVFGVKCVDFVTAWEFAERYAKAVASQEVHNDRFLTIIMTLLIWINAKNMGVSCGKGIPEPIQTYINIMHEHFDIDFEHLVND